MKYFVKIVLTLVFCIYLIVITNQILFKYGVPSEVFSHFKDESWHAYNFIPFKTIIYYLFIADINLNIRIMNLGGNIIGFIPFGLILPFLLKKFMNFKMLLIAVFSFSFTYEAFQFICNLGSFDIDDLILNTFGGALGYLPIKLVHIINSRKHKQENEVSFK
ncbi:VanZ family protein [Gottfriedia solisilvae]|uniref:VanZ-like domain-containing protein n=1 Tax=Gottfriedia solisilvae TaxID=1516104 RepID=A0A8J3ACN1_9BACI|nr:VanZ family protein [Gottfriedia solisilvae]GGI10812.1 hypothetical protein GCM10007380_04680 [Gottfriedia solisilvae]